MTVRVRDSCSSLLSPVKGLNIHIRRRPIVAMNDNARHGQRVVWRIGFVVAQRVRGDQNHDQSARAQHATKGGERGPELQLATSWSRQSLAEKFSEERPAKKHEVRLPC